MRCLQVLPGTAASLPRIHSSACTWCPAGPADCPATVQPALQAPNPLQRVLALMPLLFGSIVGTVLLLVLLQSELTAAWPLWLKGLAALAAVMLIAAAVQVRLHARSTACYRSRQLASSTTGWWQAVLKFWGFGTGLYCKHYQ